MESLLFNFFLHSTFSHIFLHSPWPQSERYAVTYLNECPQPWCIGPPGRSRPDIKPCVSGSLFGALRPPVWGILCPRPLSHLGMVPTGHFLTISMSSLPFISLSWAMSSFVTNFLDLEQLTHLNFNLLQLVLGTGGEGRPGEEWYIHRM